MSSWQGHATRLGVAISLLLHAAALQLYLVLAEPPLPQPARRPFLVELAGPEASPPPASASTGAAGRAVRLPPGGAAALAAADDSPFHGVVAEQQRLLEMLLVLQDLDVP